MTLTGENSDNKNEGLASQQFCYRTLHFQNIKETSCQEFFSLIGFLSRLRVTTI